MTTIATPATSHADGPARDSSDSAVAASATPPSPEPTPAAAVSEPTAVCPAPPTAAKPPRVLASIGDETPIRATLGSYSLTTCSTVASVDGPPLLAPTGALVAHPDDVMRLTLPSDWRFIRWEGIDDVHYDGGVRFESTELPDHPQQLDVAISTTPGERAGAYTLSVVSLDGRVIGRLEVMVATSVK